MASFYLTILNELFLDLKYATSIAVWKQPFLKKIKLKKQGGRAVHQRFVLTGARANSGTFAGAAAITGTGGARANNFEWNVPVGELFGTVRADNRDVQLSDTNEDAAARAAQFEIELGHAEFGQMVVRKLLGQPGFRIGTAEWEETAGTPAGFPTFSLRFVDPADAKHLQIGDHVVITASTDDGTESGDNPVGSVGYVIAKDDELGYAQMTTTAAITVPANPGSWVDDTVYSVYRLGELDSTGAVQNQMSNLSKYITDARATDTFNGVNRNLHGALSGVRLPTGDSAATGSLAARIKRHCAIMANRAGATHEAVVVMNPEDFDVAVSQQEAQTRREPGKSTETGYMQLTINTALGPVDIVSEPCQTKGAYKILDTSMIEMQTSNGELYSPVIPPGGTAWQLLEASNTFEARVVCLNKVFPGVPWHHGAGSAA